MRITLRTGRAVIELHEADKRTLRKARELLEFVHKNTTESTLNVAANTGSDAIGCVMTRLLAETPDQDEAEPTRKAGAA